MDKSIYIIGGGYSLKGYNFESLRNKNTIVVNRGLSKVPNLTYFVTMDYSALRKIPYRKSSHTTDIFIANFSKPYLEEINGRIIDTRYELIYNLKDFDVIIKSHKTEGIGSTLNDFRNGNNSGFCALQFAIIMGFNPIYLLGIDLTISEKTHWHGGYGESKESFQQKLDTYYQSFVQGIKELKEKRPDIKIYSCSPISKLNNLIPYKKL